MTGYALFLGCYRRVWREMRSRLQASLSAVERLLLELWNLEDESIFKPPTCPRG